MTVFDVLRNPVHVGRIAFRGASHEAQHEALIESSRFEAAERLLTERGEVAWKRRSNGTDYLLSGLVRSARCGNRYLGTVAHGRKATYRYYTCFSRNRYGRHGCQADRLPADALDEAVLESMLATYADTDLVESAVQSARLKAQASEPSIRGELRSVDTTIQKAEESLARYFDAFENGTLTGTKFAARVQAIEEKLAELRHRREQLADTIEAEALHLPTAADLSDAEDAIRDAMANGKAGQRKALLQALVAEIRVEGRAAIFPTYRLPAGPVRVISGVVDPGLQRSNQLTELNGSEIPLNGRPAQRLTLKSFARTLASTVFSSQVW